MDFNAIARTNDDTLEIDNIELNEIVAAQSQRSARTRGPPETAPVATTHELRVRLRFNPVCVAKSRDEIRSSAVFRQSVSDNAV